MSRTVLRRRNAIYQSTQHREGGPSQDCSSLTHFGKVHCQCEQERKERKPIERVEAKAPNGQFVREKE